MNYNFTDGVRKILAMAREEVVRLQHDYVGTEHILLALLIADEEPGSVLLRNLGVDFGRVQRMVETTVHRGKATIALGEYPYTTRAKNVLELNFRCRRLVHCRSLLLELSIFFSVFCVRKKELLRKCWANSG